VSWNQALVRIQEQGFLEGLPGDLEEALMTLLNARGELYRAVKCLPGFEDSSSGEYLAIATECAATALVLHRKAIAARGWRAASCLLLGDGLLTLSFELLGRQPDIDVLKFSALVSQLLGEEDPERRFKDLIVRGSMAPMLR
jgi:hypothetical protein